MLIFYYDGLIRYFINDLLVPFYGPFPASFSFSAFSNTKYKVYNKMAGQKYDFRLKNKKYTTPLPYSWDVG